MAYSFWDGIADVMTFGAYSASKAVTGAIVKATEQAGSELNSPQSQAAGAGLPGHLTGIGSMGQIPGIGKQIPGNISGTLTGMVTGTVSGTSVNVHAAAAQKCCGYKIEGDYLLNSESGQVWLISKEKLELIPIKKGLLPVESAASAINLDYMKQFLLQQKDLEISKLHHSVRGDFSKRVDVLISAVDKEILDNTKAAK